MSRYNKYVNQWIKRHNILSGNNYKKIYYKIGDKKYLVRDYKDLVRYSGGKYLELDCWDLNTNKNHEVVEFKNEEILKLKLLGEIININNESFYIIKWAEDDIENNGKVGELK